MAISYSLLEKHNLRAVDAKLGMFRTLLRTSMSHFLGNEWNIASAQRRGGGWPVLSLEEHYFGQGVVRLRELETDTEILSVVHDGAIRCLEFSPDGKRLLTAGDDATARFWNAANGTPVTSAMLHAGAVSDATFSPDGPLSTSRHAFQCLFQTDQSPHQGAIMPVGFRAVLDG